MKIATFACDICQTQKAIANRWWKVFLLKNVEDKVVGVMTVEWDVNSLPWRNDLSPEMADAHLCGVQHLVEWQSLNLLSKS